MISISDGELKELTEYIRANYGIELARKRHLVEGRLGKLISERGFGNFAEYLRFVLSDPTKREMTDLVSRLTTNHTYFMRETRHFDFFRDTVLPYLKAASPQRDLRVWSAGCSSGEEPYTLAMIMADFFGGEKYLWDTKVLATDISVDVLAAAEKGAYAAEAVNSLPAAWRLNYFRQTGPGEFSVTDRLRSEVIFRVFNLMDAVFPFRKKFQVIFCRNVMIYFDAKTKINLVNKFYELTEPGGYLFIGHTETINREHTAYKYVMPAVYRKG